MCWSVAVEHVLRASTWILIFGQRSTMWQEQIPKYWVRIGGRPWNTSHSWIGKQMLPAKKIIYESVETGI